MPVPTRFEPPTGRPLGRTVGLLVVSCLLICGAVVGVGWLICHPLAHALRAENDVNRWLADHRMSALTSLADGGTFLGQTLTGVVALGVIGAVFALWRRTWWPLVFVGVLDAGLGLFYLAGTSLDPRQRPPVPILQTGLVPNHSFPSGHTGTATAIAGSLAALLWAYTRVTGRLIALLVLVPAYTMLARLYVGAHHITDVITAFVAATLWLLVCAGLLLPPRELAAPAGPSSAASAGRPAATDARGGARPGPG